jgi:hypothetical protein
MATAATIIDNARYDLRDYGTGVNVGDTELLAYLNRVVELVSQQLASVKSDLVFAVEEDTDTVLGTASIAAPTDAHSIIEVWIGEDRLTQVSPNELYYKRKFRSGNAKPQYWALVGANIQFQQGADAAHTDVVIHYNQKPAVLTSGSNMPWNDTMNDLIVQSLVIYTRGKKDDTIEQPDSVLEKITRERVMAEVIRRNHVKKTVWIDF